MIKFLRNLFSPKIANTNDSLDTEFCAEVVRITEVIDHPNGDRLSLVRFALKSGPTTYEVVTQRNTFRVDDLAAYFSVDCLLPTTHPDFAFLAKEGRTVHRLKAARLRGVFSQGLLVKAPAGFELGDGVGDYYGVTYYREVEEVVATSTKKRSEPKGSMRVYGVASLKKIPGLFTEGEQVLVTEKCHGTNARWSWVPKKFLGIRYGWRFVVGSHRVEKPSEQNFYGEDVWVQAAERMGLAEKTKNHKGLVFYGELYGHTYSGKKIQDLTYGRAPTEGPGLVVFDIARGTGDYLPVNERLNIVSAIGFTNAPILHVGPYSKEVVERLTNGGDPSAIDGQTIREGVVVETVDGPRKKAKFVSQAYLLRKVA